MKRQSPQMGQLCCDLLEEKLYKQMGGGLRGAHKRNLGGYKFTAVFGLSICDDGVVQCPELCARRNRGTRAYKPGVLTISNGYEC